MPLPAHGFNVAMRLLEDEWDWLFRHFGSQQDAIELKGCCAKGKNCCEICGYNFLFRDAEQETKKRTHKELADRLHTQLKPVGSFLVDPDEYRGVYEYCISLNLTLVAEERVGETHFCILYFSAMPDTTIGSLCDIEAINSLTLAGLSADTTVRQLANTAGFLEERNFAVTGLLYGYPLWSAVALEQMRYLTHDSTLWRESESKTEALKSLLMTYLNLIPHPMLQPLEYHDDQDLLLNSDDDLVFQIEDLA